MKDKILSIINKFDSRFGSYYSKLDGLCGALLALVPILQHYRGIVDNAGTTLLALMIPYLMYRMLPKLLEFKVKYFKVLSVLALFFIYRLVDHGTRVSEIAQVSIMIIYFMAVSLKCIDIKTLIKTASLVSALAGIVLIVQYICYYVLGFHLQMVPVSLFAKESYAWVAGAKTGLVGVNGKLGTLYRPSAFFLEPSHLFMYSFPVLFITLFHTDKKKYNIFIPLLITVGLFLSTSGMGMAVGLATWSLFFVLWNHKEHNFKIDNIFRKRTALFIGVVVALAILAFIFVPTVRNTVLRIFIDTEGSSNAISGRINGALSVVNNLNFIQNFIGMSDTTIFISYNMPGFMATMYKYGIIGIILSYEFYVKSLFKLDLSYALTSALLLVVSFFSAHTHGTFFMIYYVMILMNGHLDEQTSWIKESIHSLKSRFAKPVKEV